ncbi:MAG TPA: glycerophosphodiester phosphodiesterase family protein [Ktedonobacterales bacterium]
MTNPSVVCYAHRGASAYLPENTLPAFRLAHVLGADGFECDVRMTADEALVIIHDATVDRTTDGSGRVASLTLASLRALNAGTKKRPAPIPTLAETLALARELNMRVNLELKGERVEETIALAHAITPALARLKVADRAPVLISSFEHDALSTLRASLPWLQLGALYDSMKWSGTDILAHALALGVNAIHPGERLINEKLIQGAGERGLAVNVWTANRRPVIRRLIRLGVNGLFSDRPERVVIERTRQDLLTVDK